LGDNPRLDDNLRLVIIRGFVILIDCVIVVRLRELAMLQFTPSLEEVTARVKKLDSLQIALRTQPHSFVARFLEVSVS
jgi:hypothetical protein